MMTLPCPETSMFKQWDSFEALVAERGKGIRVEKVIRDRSDKKIFVLMKVVVEESPVSGSSL